MTKIYLFPKAARQMPEAEFQPLIDDLREDQPDLTSEYVWYETRAYGVTWWEVLTVYIAVKAGDAMIDATAGKLVEALIEKGKAWIQRRREAKGGRRPFALTVRDAEGNILAAIDVEVDGKSKDATATRPPKELPPFELAPDDIQ